jgi:DNA-binding transcriptional ArsR family regulator
VRKVLEPRGYFVVRADEIDDEGLITNQIIEHLLEDELVIADLSGRNPNVFYEVAVRHAARRPIIHLITAGEQIPFDVSNMRAIQYALDDPDVLEEAQDELDRKVAAIETSDGEAALNPITVARDVALLRGSDNPKQREAGDILAAVSDLKDELRSLGRRVSDGGTPGVHAERALSDERITATRIRRAVATVTKGGSTVPVGIVELLLDSDLLSTREIADRLVYSQSTVSRHLRILEEGDITERNDGLWRLTQSFVNWLGRAGK